MAPGQVRFGITTLGMEVLVAPLGVTVVSSSTSVVATSGSMVRSEGIPMVGDAGSIPTGASTDEITAT